MSNVVGLNRSIYHQNEWRCLEITAVRMGGRPTGRSGLAQRDMLCSWSLIKNGWFPKIAKADVMRGLGVSVDKNGSGGVLQRVNNSGSGSLHIIWISSLARSLYITRFSYALEGMLYCNRRPKFSLKLAARSVSSGHDCRRGPGV